MNRPTDRSRIEPLMVKLALRWGWRYRLRLGNSGQPPDGIEGRVVSDVDMNTGMRTKQAAPEAKP